jgi:hypothetical protein
VNAGTLLKTFTLPLGRVKVRVIGDASVFQKPVCVPLQNPKQAGCTCEKGTNESVDGADGP